MISQWFSLVTSSLVKIIGKSPHSRKNDRFIEGFGSILLPDMFALSPCLAAWQILNAGPSTTPLATSVLSIMTAICPAWVPRQSAPSIVVSHVTSVLSRPPAPSPVPVSIHRDVITWHDVTGLLWGGIHWWSVDSPQKRPEIPTLDIIFAVSLDKLEFIKRPRRP